MSILRDNWANFVDTMLEGDEEDIKLTSDIIIQYGISNPEDDHLIVFLYYLTPIRYDDQLRRHLVKRYQWGNDKLIRKLIDNPYEILIDIDYIDKEMKLLFKPNKVTGRVYE